MRTRHRHSTKTIDLDLILFGSATVSPPALTIPDPDIQSRPYSAVPLSELSPGLQIPGKDCKIKEIVASIEAAPMERLAGYTELLRRRAPRAGD